MSLQPFSAAVFAPGHGPLGRIAGAISHDEQRVRAVPSFGLVPVTLEFFPNLTRFACSHRYGLLAIARQMGEERRANWRRGVGASPTGRKG